MKTWRYCWKAYWKHCYEVNADSTCIWFRTPLIAVGFQRNALTQDKYGRWSGWSVDWFPSNWILWIPESGDLYRHHWDNLKSDLTIPASGIRVVT